MTDGIKRYDVRSCSQGSYQIVQVPDGSMVKYEDHEEAMKSSENTRMTATEIGLRNELRAHVNTIEDYKKIVDLHKETIERLEKKVEKMAELLDSCGLYFHVDRCIGKRKEEEFRRLLRPYMKEFKDD